MLQTHSSATARASTSWKMSLIKHKNYATKVMCNSRIHCRYKQHKNQHEKLQNPQKQKVACNTRRNIACNTRCNIACNTSATPAHPLRRYIRVLMMLRVVMPPVGLVVPVGSSARRRRHPVLMCKHWLLKNNNWCKIIAFWVAFRGLV